MFRLMVACLLKVFPLCGRTAQRSEPDERSATSLLGILCLLLLLPIFSSFVLADEAHVIEYRRIFLPDGAIDHFPFPPQSLPVSRQQIENWLEQVEQKPERHGDVTQDNVLHHLATIVLKARLESGGQQLTSGQGTFTFHSPTDAVDTDAVDSVPFEPLAMAVSALRWSDGTGAILFCDSEGTTRLAVSPRSEPPKSEPPKVEPDGQTDSPPGKSLHFRWSLQSRKNQRNDIVFDLSLPPCLSIEVHLELPKSLALTSSAGLVFPEEEGNNTDPGFRTWRVLLGHNSTATLTITADKTSQTVKRKSAIRQEVIYTITPKGLETITQITFDKFDPRLDELFLELELPLRPVEVRYGDEVEFLPDEGGLHGGRLVPWTRTALSSETTEMRIDLSSSADEEPQKLVVRSLGPLQEDQRWVLPRVRVLSSDAFWLETRCRVRVTAPLRTRNLISHQAVQVEPRLSVDRTLLEVHVFQFFQEDSQIELEVFYSPPPPITINSVVQTRWGNNEIQSTVFLECSVTEGEHYTLNFPTSEHWIIDSVNPYLPPTGTSEDNLTLDVLETPQTLSVQLSRPLIPRRPVLLQLSCRLRSSSQRPFRLAELSPLALTRRHGETHYIATQLDLTDYSFKPGAEVPVSDVPPTILFGGNPLNLSGNIYPLNSQTEDTRFELVRTPPNYTAEISGNVFVDDTEMRLTFQIHCTPVDSSIDRLYVHFTPFHEQNTGQRWEWSLAGESDSFHAPRTRKVSPEELAELMPLFEPQNRSEDLERGEVWEIRLDAWQSTPFDLSVTSFVPLADSMPIPFASLPLASSQRGRLQVEALGQFDYQIVSSRLDSIPIAPPPWDQYQSIHAAFQYNPQEEMRRSQISLLLQKITPEERVDTAWIWSLRLDSQFEPEGFVRNTAFFLVENKGKDTLQIKLSHDVAAANVSAVWLNSKQIPWQYDSHNRTIVLALPTRQRFVSISIDYTYQDMPLVQKRKLRPHYPSADVPILGGSWITWFPPEFEVSLRRKTRVTENLIPLSKALDYLATGATYRTFLGGMWDDVFGGRKRRAEAETAAGYFFKEVLETLQKNPIATWGDLLGNEKVLPAVTARLTNDMKQSVQTQLLIDRQALTFLGITPATPIDKITSFPQGQNIRDFFEHAGLVLLVALRTRSDGIRDYTFSLTTPTTLALNRQFQPIPAGHCVRVVPFEAVDTASQWVPLSRWLSETALSSIPWSTSTQHAHQLALTVDWNAYELSMDVEQPLYIVHRQKMAAFQWIAFLSMVLLACRKPFSSPQVLFVLLIVFELTARSVAPCYVGIPSGAFLGVLVSLGFVLIRSQIHLRTSPKPDTLARHDSTECSVSFVPTSLHARSLLLGLLLACISTSATAQTLSERIQALSRKEPYPVVYPTTPEHREAAEHVWLPAEFADLLHREIESKKQAELSQWRIGKAVYQGSLIYGTSGQLECSDDFRAVYDIHFDSSRATITLPNLPASGKCYWNTKPIFPIDDAKNETLSFLIENESPGKHVLEIALSPTVSPLKGAPQNGDDMVQFSIPKVPDSTLRLSVPPNTPPIQVSGARGAVTENTVLSPTLTAELGAISELSFSWIDDPNRSETLTTEVEQYFLIVPKPSQSPIELQALFRFSINGGTVRHVTIQTDPRWFRSGQFRWIETNSELRAVDSLTDASYSMSQIDFPTPVTGPITLRANFGLRDFNGIGNLRLPQFTAHPSSHVTKSMLAISADPQLELNCPIEGRDSGFEVGWLGPIPWEITSFFTSGRTDLFGERLVAQYDLTKTEPTWTLAIRAKKTIPQVAITQSIQFDAGKSKVHVRGDFTASSNVYQQYFSAEQPIQVETVEVRDALGNIVESRFQRIAPNTTQYLIFLKTSVTGKYVITIRGSLATDVREETPQQPLPVPVLTFGDVEATNHSLNLFRTSAVLADIVSPEGSDWSKSETAPSAPESFVQPVPLGIWRKAPPAASAEVSTTDAPKMATTFALSSNHPKVNGKTVLSLQPTETDDQWMMTLDFTGDVTSGELKSLSFRWDERCTIMPPTDIPWSVEQSGEQWTLVLSPAEPMRGEQQFQIVVSLDTSGTTTLPNVFPLSRGIDQLESELFVDLPRQRGSEIIPWDLRLLEPVDESTEEESRLRFRAIGTDYKVTINRTESRLIATFYDISFLMKREGSITGVATIDLRNRGQDSFILQMPPGYELLQISSARSLPHRTPLAGRNRWMVDIGTHNYPQRVSILFRTSLPHPLHRWSREQMTATLQVPLLEGVAVQETIWAVVFEGDDLPSLNVVTMLDRHGELTMIHETNDLGDHPPLSGREVSYSVVGLNLVRGHNLLRVLESFPVTGTARREEMRHWYSHWLEEWDAVADKVDFFGKHLSLTSQNIKPKLLARPLDSSSDKEETPRIVRSFVETMGAQTGEALRTMKEQSVQERFAAVLDAVPKQSAPILNSPVYWQGRLSAEMQCLFGVEEGTLREIRLTPMPVETQWTHQFADHVWLWIAVLLLIPVLVLLSVHWVHWMELWLQFPHFWGMIAGVLLWTFVPTSFAGLAIIVLTFVSLFRPSWPRYRSVSKPF